MTTFFTLLLAHLLADFPLQTNRIFRLKVTSKAGLALHVLIHVGMAGVLLRTPAHCLDLLLALGVAHFFTDWIKVRFPVEPQWPGFLLDQLAHLGAIASLAWWRPEATAVLPLWLMLPLILFVLLPAALMLLWVWANDAQHQNRFQNSRSVHWASNRLLTISQRTGWVAVLVVLASRLVLL
ncbi:MAG: DUF3307 domain-containing protein [Ardenticatenaceae bacterium]|nr:DUF3307 domain-containing protein [Anaerolineales bacterium]MCB8942124.1 DUF3307 domain-containing protein [Ardenticatenaceae bacterium]MCB8973148.1 DUF3307 domain-containing protein [Ardenticatenaceae bacterium]